MVKFGVAGIPFTISRGSLKEIKEFCKIADESRIDTVWTGDGAVHADPYAILNIMAWETKRVELALGATNPYTRDPFVTAFSIGYLNEISGGRALLALGAGSREMLAAINMKWDQPVKRCRETIEIVRRILTGEKLTYDGEIFETHEAHLLDRRPAEVPIYLACRRPRMMTMAGSVADGVLLDGVPVEYVGYAINKVGEGLKTAGRRKNFRYANCIMCMISEDGDAARNIVKRFPFPQFLIMAPHQMLEMAKIGLEEVAAIQNAVPNWDKASELVSDEVVEKLSITGTPQECLRRFRAYIEKGIDEFNLVFPLGADMKKMIRFLDEDIIPRIEENA